MDRTKHAGINRRGFLRSASAATGALVGLGASSSAAHATTVSTVAQRIDTIRMYMTHYALFDEPDGKIPAATYLNVFGQLDAGLTLTAPVAAQAFLRWGGEGQHLFELAAGFKPMPYRISPPGFSLAETPAPLLLWFELLLRVPVRAADVTPFVVAIGTFQLPPAWAVRARLDGSHFTVRKPMVFRVQIRQAFIHGAAHVGLVLPYVTNGEAAAFLGLPPPANPLANLFYSWTTTMTLSTTHVYVRDVATEPPPAAEPFEPDETQIRFIGSPIDADGRYTLVGSVGRPDFVAPPVSSVPGILQVLFGTTNLTDVEWACAETGVFAG